MNALRQLKYDCRKNLNRYQQGTNSGIHGTNQGPGYTRGY